MPGQAEPASEEIGEIVAFFAAPSAAIVELRTGSLKIGDKIWIRGHTTDLTQTIDSMQIERQPVSEAQAGQQVAIRVSSKCRRNDRVYKIL